jgi:hypothetical protein
MVRHLTLLKLADEPLGRSCTPILHLLLLVRICPTGVVKASLSWHKLALLAIAAGCYCGFGFTLCLIVGGNAPGE